MIVAGLSLFLISAPSSWEISNKSFMAIIFIYVFFWVLLGIIILLDFFKRDWANEETDREEWKQVLARGYIARGMSIASDVYYLKVIRKLPLNNLTAWCLKNKLTRQLMDLNSIVHRYIFTWPVALIMISLAPFGFWLKSDFLFFAAFKMMGTMFLISLVTSYGGLFGIIVLNDMLSYETEEDFFSQYKNKMGRYYDDYMKDRVMN